MTRQELSNLIRTLPSGTIAQVIGNSKYSAIDTACTNSVLYVIEKATENEIENCVELDDVIEFIRQHRNYRPVWA